MNSPVRIAANLFVSAVFATAGIYAEQTELALAAAAPTQSSVAVVAGLGCSTPAGSNTFNVVYWNVGATLASIVVGKPTVSPMSITKAFDACSTTLFSDMLLGTSLMSLILTASENPGGTILTVELDSVHAASYQLADYTTLPAGILATNPGPYETIFFSYTKITVTNHATNTKVCWNTLTNMKC